MLGVPQVRYFFGAGDVRDAVVYRNDYCQDLVPVSVGPTF